MSNQENSFTCKKCKLSYSEESGAFKGFICETCMEDYDLEYCIECQKYKSKHKMFDNEVCKKCNKDQYDGEFNPY